MCEKSYRLVKRRFFKNKYRKQRTYCLCGAESTWSGLGKMLDAGYSPEQIKEAIKKLISNAR